MTSHQDILKYVKRQFKSLGIAIRAEDVVEAHRLRLLQIAEITAYCPVERVLRDRQLLDACHELESLRILLIAIAQQSKRYKGGSKQAEALKKAEEKYTADLQKLRLFMMKKSDTLYRPEFIDSYNCVIRSDETLLQTFIMITEFVRTMSWLSSPHLFEIANGTHGAIKIFHDHLGPWAGEFLQRIASRLLDEPEIADQIPKIYGETSFTQSTAYEQNELGVFARLCLEYGLDGKSLIHKDNPR